MTQRPLVNMYIRILVNLIKLCEDHTLSLPKFSILRFSSSSESFSFEIQNSEYIRTIRPTSGLNEEEKMINSGMNRSNGKLVANNFSRFLHVLFFLLTKSKLMSTSKFFLFGNKNKCIFQAHKWTPKLYSKVLIRIYIVIQ